MQERLTGLANDPDPLVLFRNSYFQRAEIRLTVVRSERDFCRQLQAAVPDLAIHMPGSATVFRSQARGAWLNALVRPSQHGCPQVWVLSL